MAAMCRFLLTERRVDAAWAQRRVSLPTPTACLQAAYWTIRVLHQWWRRMAAYTKVLTRGTTTRRVTCCATVRRGRSSALTTSAGTISQRSTITEVHIQLPPTIILTATSICHTHT